MPKLLIWNIWAEMVQNGTKTKTDHLEHLGGLRHETAQNGTKTDHLEVWAALGSSPDAGACAHALRSPREVGLKGDEIACSDA